MQYRIRVIDTMAYIGTPYRQEKSEPSRDGQIVTLWARRQDRLQQASKDDGATLATIMHGRNRP